MSLEDIYYLVGYIICDAFLMWYLPSDTIVEVIIDIMVLLQSLKKVISFSR